MQDTINEDLFLVGQSDLMIRILERKGPVALLLLIHFL